MPPAGESAARLSETLGAEVCARLMLHDCFPFPGCPLVKVEVLDREVADLLARMRAQG